MFCHDNDIKDANVFGILNTKYHPQKVFGEVFKYPEISMYLVFYLNTKRIFDTTLMMMMMMMIKCPLH